MPGILLDVARLLHQRLTGEPLTGIDRVSMEYIRHFGDRARAVLSLGPIATAASRADSTRLFDKLLAEGRGLGLLTAEMTAKAWLWYWLRPGGKGSVLINTGNFWMNQRLYAAYPRLMGAQLVFFIHDLIPISHPEYFPADGKSHHLAIIRNALTIARGLIVNSRDTHEALLRSAEGMGLPCPPTVVAPLAPSIAATRAAGPPPVHQPYFVCIGTIEPRKNHLLLLHLWRHLIEQHGEAAPRLFVIGKRGWECENIVDLLERCDALRGYVIEENDCGDDRLATILHHARALLMPSFAEGFGLPVAEALAAGVPVIATDLPAFREIAGEIPEFADPIDGRRWAELVLEYARPDSPLRSAQLDRMRGYVPGTWARHFEIVDRFLETLG